MKIHSIFSKIFCKLSSLFSYIKAPFSSDKKKDIDKSRDEEDMNKLNERLYISRGKIKKKPFTINPQVL